MDAKLLSLDTGKGKHRRHTRRLTENELICGMRRGDAETFRSLYHAYSASLLGLILKIVGQQEAAEDVLQECFVKIHTNFHSYDENKSRLFTWMLNLCRNASIDYLRKRATKTSQKTCGLEEISREKAERFIYSVSTDTIGLKSIVDHLPDRQKMIVELVYYKGYTHSEVAEYLAMPLGSVKTALRLAMNQLRTFFSELPYNKMTA